MIYKIYSGVDYGSFSFRGQSIFENLVQECKTLEGALYEYQKVKNKCKNNSRLAENKYKRFFCYIVQINKDERIRGIHKEDNGYDAITYYANSYTQSLDIDTFREIKNIEKGKVIS